jgi:hypothetical protein
MWICPKCAAHNDDKAHVCPVCGTRQLSGPGGGSVPEYPVPVDPWASQADTQAVMSPFDHAPSSGAPTSATPHSGAPTSPSPASGGPSSGGLSSGGPSFGGPSSGGPSSGGPSSGGSSSGGPNSSGPSFGGPNSGGQGFGGPNSGGQGFGGPNSGAPALARPTSAPPTSAGPRTPAPTRPFAGAIVPAPQPPTQSVTQYPIRPATIEVTQRNGVPLRWVITIAAVLVVGVGVAAAIVVPQLISDDHGGTPSPTIANGSSAPGPAPNSADPTGGGLIVATAPGLTDGRADEVIAMLDVYFNAINTKDYPIVASVLDPDGTTDPEDADDMAELAAGTRSTTDSHVTLTSLDDADDGLLSAEVTFQSNQKAGDGPEDRPDETCTQWDIIYTLSYDKVYKILKSDATSQPC